MWLVMSGQVSVFATQVSNEEPIGERRYLFTINPGEILCGVAVTQQLGILAVALEDVEVQQFSYKDISGQITQGNHSAIALLEGWLRHLAESITLESSHKTPSSENTTISPCSPWRRNILRLYNSLFF